MSEGQARWKQGGLGRLHGKGGIWERGEESCRKVGEEQSGVNSQHKRTKKETLDVLKKPHRKELEGEMEKPRPKPPMGGQEFSL